MELSPQSVSSTTFKIVKRGFDPDEVKAYLGQLATAIEATQSQATAMEARARAAVVRLQEIAAQTPMQSAPAPTPISTPVPAQITASADESETISRTLLLAQRTADQTVAEATTQAKSITENAHNEARITVANAQDHANRLIDDAKAEARRAGEGQRIQIESEVQALMARREFLLSDVDYLEQYIVTQRDRLRDVSSSLTEIIEKVPGGLGDLRRPLVSGAGGDNRDDSSGTPRPVAPAPPSAMSQNGASASSAVPSPSALSSRDIDELAEIEDPDATVAMARPTGDAHLPPTHHAEPAPDNSGPINRFDLPPEGDPTPPEGMSSKYLFEDITADLPAVYPPASNDVTIGGEELR
jgi:DivIVA domain-containing protein